ncbi:MAG TPA: cupin domain-containing protein [Candidatus Dormibacteraeota bacterium]|jgi:quercetin dioxygenase-like cupin family protein|nr:cupin domain-containing protein [Candidatus Dormibacteraeota bacterium]
MSERDPALPVSFLVHVDEVPAAPVRAEEGWQDVDIRFLVGEERGGVRSACLFRTLFPPGAAHRPHRHPRADEVLYVLRGRARVGADGEEREVGAGTAQFVPAGVVHWLRNPGAETVEVVGAYLGVGSLAEAGYEPVAEPRG